MKLLLDQNISYRLPRDLQSLIPELTHVKFGRLQDAEDHEIWNYARQHDFTIVTFDADFYEIQTIKGAPPKIIWHRFGNTTRQEFADFFIRNIDKIREFADSEEFADFNCLEFKSF